MTAGEHETIFTIEATPVKFGAGAAQDAGWELARLGVRRAFVVVDPGVRGWPGRFWRACARRGPTSSSGATWRPSRAWAR